MTRAAAGPRGRPETSTPAVRKAVVTRFIFSSLLALFTMARPGQTAGQTAPDHASTYRDAETAVLVEAAREHHRFRVSQLAAYRAKIFTRAEGRVARGRFGRGAPLFTYEAAANIQWRDPGDVRVEMLGARSRTAPLPGLRRDRAFGFWTDELTSDPWFIPAAMGDDIQMMGVPDEEAVHPLARLGSRYYRYAIIDSIEIGLPGRTVRTIAVQVDPTVYGPTLLSGTMWLDADSLDVVRMSGAFVGPDIWEDDPDSPVLEAIEVDLEYALVQNQFWLPYRQILSLSFTYKYLPGATLPTTAVTTFSDYDVEVDQFIPFADMPAGHTGRRFGPRWDCTPFIWDYHRGRRDVCGEGGFTRSQINDDGRWEVVVPPLDSLAAYEFDREFEVPRELARQEQVLRQVGDIARFTEDLPEQFVDRPRASIDLVEALQAFGYNRVQGASLGGAVLFRPGPAFTTLQARGRFGFSDLRPTGGLTWRRDGPGGRLDITAFREILPVEPWTVTTPVGHALRALFTGRDDADYFLRLGGGLSYAGYQGTLRNVELYASFERQRSVSAQSRSAINDAFFGSGTFPPNPPIAEGDFLRAGGHRSWYAGAATFRVGIDGLVNDTVQSARIWGAADVRYELGAAEGRLRVRGGSVLGDSLSQMLVRAGGSATVRGYTYGTRRGRHFWSAQWDQTLRDPALWTPIVLADVADVVQTNYVFDPLVSVGMGAAFLNDWIRFEFVKGVNPSAAVHFDLLVGLPF